MAKKPIDNLSFMFPPKETVAEEPRIEDLLLNKKMKFEFNNEEERETHGEQRSTQTKDERRISRIFNLTDQDNSGPTLLKINRVENWVFFPNGICDKQTGQLLKADVTIEQFKKSWDAEQKQNSEAA